LSLGATTPRQGRTDGAPGIAQGVAEYVQPGARSYDRARVERPQVQRIHIQEALRCRIRCKQHLKPAVEHEAVDSVGAHAPAYAVASVIHRDIDSPLVEDPRACQSRQPRSDTYHFHAKRAPRYVNSTRR
jgi:hypothetical protein